MRIKMRGRHRFRFVIALFLTILTSIGATAQQYAVYKVSGNAGVVQGARVRPLTRGKAIEADTRLRIGSNSEVWVIERKYKGAVYKFRQPTGKEGATVKSLVAKVKNRTQAGIDDVNKKILDGISVNKTRNDEFTRAGVSRVVTNASGSETELHSLIGPYVAPKVPHPYKPVTVKKVNDGNRLFHFALTSKEIDGLYANIILKDCNADNMEFLFPANLVLAKGQTKDMSDCMFMVPKRPFPGYILILSDEPFTLDDILAELDVNTQNTERHFVYQIID